MQAISDIFAIWPSTKEMADDLGQKYDTVLRWKLRKRIPSTAWPTIIEKAAARETLVTAAQLLAANAPRRRSMKAKAA